MSPEWGSVPEWLAGVGGILAVGAVVVTFLWERWHTNRNRDRAQAERVTYYLCEGRSAYPVGGAGPGIHTDRTPVDAGWFSYQDAPGYDWGHLVLVNNSESCVYECIAWVPDSPLQLHGRGIGVIPPGVTRVSMPMRSYPGEGSGAWTRHNGDFANNKLIPWIQFKDQAGVAWRRGGDGALNEEANPIPFPDYSP